MSEPQELWSCPQCGCQQDISHLGFFAEIACPQCGKQSHVHALLANYKIESVLGIGGMSVVFQARDLVLGRPLAIKVLNDTYRDTPERIASLENECALMAKVRHENVVSVYSAGWARGQFYIAMELIEGRNLELIVADRGYLLPTDALEVVRQVSVGLRSAHQAGLLHRDVKPGNVLITPEGQAKVLDFGLSLEDTPEVEKEDIIWATPYYVPPETLRREEESVQTDIYALGMSLRNLLTGETTLPGNPQTIADMLVSKSTLPSISSVAPHLEPELCALVDMMTAFDPEKRPADYDGVLELISAAQDALNEAADPEVRASRYRDKLYVACGALASIGVGVLGAFLVALVTPSGRVQESLEVEALQWQTRDTYLAAEAALKSGNAAKAGELFASLTGEDVETTVAAASALMRTSLDALEGKATANGYNRFGQISARSADSLSACGVNAYDKMKTLMAALREDPAKAAGMLGGIENPLLRAAAHILVADAYVHSGRNNEAEEMIDAAVAVYKECGADAFNASLDEYRTVAPRRAARVMLGEVKNMYRDGRLSEANAKVDELLKHKLARLEKEELRVLGEASALMQAARDMLARCGVQNLRADVSPDDLRVAAAGKGSSENLPKELYCLGLMLQGQYDAAFRENPHAANAESNEPFAVVMRDWKKRLEK